jgi:hypothetical protein
MVKNVQNERGEITSKTKEFSLLTMYFERLSWIYSTFDAFKSDFFL